MNGLSALQALFRCDGADVPADLAAQSWDRREEITSVADDGATNLRLDTLAAKLGGHVRERAQDLVYIASYCAAADQQINRGSKNVDVHREQWRRRLTLCIPVADVAFWSRSDVTAALSNALYFATEDTWTFVFTQRTRTGNMQLSINELDDRSLMGSPDCVLLVSGGTDSLCALVEAIGDQGLHPIAVSHRPANHIHKWQTDLLDEVRRRFPHWNLPHVSFTMHRQGQDDADPSQRTRPFLFAALGTAIASSYGIDRVLLADNGYVSINPPISGELAGALASRGTHLTLLRLLTDLNRLMAEPGEPVVQVENPLAYRTRAEALRILSRFEIANLLSLTHTCGKHRNRSRHQPHCGFCSQCVDRRFATLAAGLAAFDPADTYGVNVFTDDLPIGEARKIAVSYVRFARETRNLEDEEFVLRYPELIACLDPGAPNAPLMLAKMADLLRRHAAEVLAVLGDQYREHGDALALQVLPPMCLLRLHAAMGADEIPTPIAAASDEQPETQKPRCEITLQGRICHITFDGEKATVRALTGMRQLTRLLKAPGQELTALDLKTGSSPTTQAHAELYDDGLSMNRHRDDPVLDNEARRKYKDRAAAIADELKRDISPSKREKLLDELEWINHDLKRHVGLKGKSRSHNDPNEQARTLISKNIHKALDEIEPVMPGLHAHLKEALHLGTVCCYEPHPVLT